MLVRCGGLADSMSRYLIRRIEENPAIELRTHTEIVALEGDDRSRARALARQRGPATIETARHRPRLHDDRRRPEHARGSTAASRSTRRGSSRPGPICRRTSWRRALAADTPAASARDEPARRVRRRRRARRQHQARRVGGRRRIDRRVVRPSGAAGIEHGGSRERSTGPRASPDDDRVRLADAGAAPRRRRGSRWQLLIAAAATAGYLTFLWRHPAALPNSTAAAPSATAAYRRRRSSGKGESIPLPPLDASDTLVRTLVQGLTESPAVMAWLPTNGLIRNFTVVVTNIAEGRDAGKTSEGPASRRGVPGRHAKRRHLRRSAQLRSLRADRRCDRIGQRGGAAKLYATLKPRIEEAQRDLGAADSFDHTLERAIVALLNTPTIDGSERLKPKGIGYGYADDRLESLSPAQKQLLRMGPRHVRVVKAKLREIALALGIPASHLPSA